MYAKTPTKPPPLKCTVAGAHRSISRTITCTSANPSPILRQRPHYKTPQPPKPSANINSGAEEKATASDVLRLLDTLQLPVDADTYSSLIKECTSSGDAVEGARVHARINRPKEKRSGCSKRDLVGIANRLLLMYAACDRPEIARKLFDGMPMRNLSSWATVICGTFDRGDRREAIALFLDMMESKSFAVEPTDTLAVLVTVMIRSCGQTGELSLGKQIHGFAIKTAMAAELGTCLVRLYAELNYIESARKVFDSMLPATMTACTSLIRAYCRKGRLKEALCVFGDTFCVMRLDDDEKKNESVSSAISSIIGGCAKRKRKFCGQQVHARAIKVGLECDLYVGTSLVNMYGRFGLLDDARRAFEFVCGKNNKEKDVACWNAMITSYIRNGCFTEAEKTLYLMKAAGIEPLESVVSRVMMACGS
ncbi:uncharacterized protein A4U43_C07F21050 [Asparagus officinalis]|uniref:Pentacotripeptide-repeat region of PRORP domain-containing protein n=1 Tax=Asparagus officinalis TaxID=4686 RepID=A0A5P1EFK3_ASPOF|nr:pentatricopeptide repeat-containing protein At1g31790-like [Asparagus officinalis]ONK63997.1 uncharacterized protein A4U43_C07F21050 [Asparagus officinalis]